MNAAVEVELFRHLFAALCDEMGIVLRKSSYSANIKERRDYSCAVYGPDGETLAMGDHMPVHLGAMPESVAHIRRGLALAPGDIAIVNDPFRGGTHLPDITAVAPVFLPGASAASFYLANRAHHADVGGMSPGSMPMAREIYQEGLRIPPVHLMRGGTVDEQIMSLILANVRTPDERRGDLMAQIASIERGRARLLELIARYGAPRVSRNSRLLLDYAERRMRARLAQLPPGCYRAADSLDGDGSGSGPIAIQVEIRIANGAATVDFSGSAPQAAGPVNANHAVTLSSVGYAFRCLHRDEVPFNAGLLRPIEVINPEGLVTNARPPAAMAAGNVETSQRITDVLLEALSAAAPGAIPACSSGTMNNLSFGGWDAQRERPFAYYETIAGGMGAGPLWPGQSAVHTHMTNSLNTPVEAFEHAYPVRVRQYRVRAQSGGLGARTGGDGIVRDLEFLAPAEVTILSDRRDAGPPGLDGGAPGSTGRNTLTRLGRQRRLPAKTRFEVEPGDRLRIETPGGGGHGS